MIFPVNSSTRYFTNTTGSHSKFWDISGFHVTPSHGYFVRYGRIGSGGSVRLKNFSSRLRAIKAARRIIGEKIGHGYVEHDSHCNGFPEERASYGPLPIPDSSVEGLRPLMVMRPPTVVSLGPPDSRLGSRVQEGLGPLTSPAGAEAAAAAIGRANEDGRFLNTADVSTYLAPTTTNPLAVRTFTVEPASRAHTWTYKESTMTYWCAECHSEVQMVAVQNARDQAELDALLGRHCQGMPARYSDPEPAHDRGDDLVLRRTRKPEPEPGDHDPGRMISFEKEK